MSNGVVLSQGLTDHCGSVHVLHLCQFLDGSEFLFIPDGLETPAGLVAGR